MLDIFKKPKDQRLGSGEPEPRIVDILGRFKLHDQMGRGFFYCVLEVLGGVFQEDNIAVYKENVAARTQDFRCYGPLVRYNFGELWRLKITPSLVALAPKT